MSSHSGISCKHKSMVLESIAANTDIKQWHASNFEKIKSNEFHLKQWIQPSCDHRTYKYLQLTNGMKILLIYDNKQERKSFEKQDKEECHNNSESSNVDLETNGNNYYNVSLCVEAGYFNDFKDLAGIAHYTEHMLFMGNKKYPKENAWEDWLALKGGSANASTYNYFTNYVYDIAPKGKQLLFESLDRFAHNFISPLFNPDSSDRELNAIENEFNFHKTDDAYKQWLVLKQHVQKSEDIPYYKFGSGNKSTLSSKHINERLLEFYEHNYDPQRMSLVVLSDIALTELEPFVVDLFEQIKSANNSSIHEEEQKQQQSKYDKLQQHPLRLEPNLLQPVFGQLFRVNSVKAHYTLDIYWMLNGRECSTYYDSSPSTFISELLGHEGSGSLHALLNDHNWINTLECGYEDNVEGMNHAFEMFEINLDLTQKGYDHVYDILQYVFQYLSMLKHETLRANGAMHEDTADDDMSMKQYWTESKLLGDIAFNFAHNSNGWQFVDDLSIKMHQFPIHHLLSCDYIYWTYDPLLLLQTLKELTPDRCCVMMQSIDAINYKHDTEYKEMTSIDDRIHGVEPILDTKYTLEEIPKCYLIAKKNNSLFHLPQRNTFIPSDLKLLSDDVFKTDPLYRHFLDIEWKEKDGAELLVYNECMKMYYKLDRTYFLPKTYITIAFEHHAIWSQDAQNMTALSLLVDMFDQYFSKQSYPATLAGLDFEFSQNWRGLKLRISGYSQKLYQYFTHLLHEMKSFTFDEELFNTQKHAFIRHLNNAIIDCEDHLSYIGRRCIIHNAVSIDSELIAAKQMTMKQVEFVRDLLFAKHNNEVRVYGLFMGNISPQIVQNASKYIMDMFHIEHDPKNTKHIALYQKYDSLLQENRFLSSSDQRSIRLSFSKCKCRAMSLPRDAVYIYKETCISFEEENSGTSLVFAMSDETVDSRTGMLCSLLTHILSEPFYDSLRTKQQLGYQVNVTYETVANIPFIKFQIISSQFNPHYLTLQILKFINDTFYNEFMLDSLQRNNYEKIKEKIDSSIRSRKMESQSLSSRHNMYWSEIFTYNTLTFDAKLEEVQALQQITFEHIKALYDEKLLLNNEPKCVILQTWTQDEHENNQNIQTVQELQQRICSDLQLQDTGTELKEIEDILCWQKTLNVLHTYL